MGVERGPICIDPEKCTLLWEVLASVQVASTVPLPCICPVQAMLADIPFAFMETPVTWQSPRCGVEIGPPYLSIMAWVTQT
jgi:hypothetical protein